MITRKRKASIISEQQNQGLEIKTRPNIDYTKQLDGLFTLFLPFNFT